MKLSVVTEAPVWFNNEMKHFYVLRYTESDYKKLHDTFPSFSELNQYGIFMNYNEIYPQNIICSVSNFGFGDNLAVWQEMHDNLGHITYEQSIKVNKPKHLDELVFDPCFADVSITKFNSMMDWYKPKL